MVEVVGLSEWLGLLGCLVWSCNDGREIEDILREPPGPKNTNTKRNLCTPFPDTWHVGPPQVGGDTSPNAHTAVTLLLNIARVAAHCGPAAE